MDSIIKLENISKSFPVVKRYRDMITKPFKKEYVEVLTGINLEIKKGEIFGLVGANGAGKTTILKIISNLILPSSGSVNIFGTDVMKNGDRAKQKVGYVLSSDRSFYWRLTGYQNLEFFGALNNIEPQRLKTAVEAALGLVGLSDFSDMQYMKYSSGMQQRLAMVRALLDDPEILLLDEPTKSLDLISAEEIRRITNELAKRYNKTIILASHNLDEVEELCDRVAFVSKGAIVYSGAAKNIKRRFRYMGKGLELVKG